MYLPGKEGKLLVANSAAQTSLHQKGIEAAVKMEFCNDLKDIAADKRGYRGVAISGKY